VVRSNAGRDKAAHHLTSLNSRLNNSRLIFESTRVEL
jgi:hypothetical protein